MARRPKPTDDTPAQPTAAHMRHIRKLGLDYPFRYLEWCREHGFETSFDKKRDQLEAELRKAEEIAAEIKRQARLHRNPRHIIEAAFKGEITSAEIKRPQWRDLVATIERVRLKDKNREALCAFFLWAERDTDFLFETFSYNGTNYPVAGGLIKIFDRRRSWLRRPEDFRKSTHNAERQFGALLRHLFARFPVPAFMDQAWLIRSGGGYKVRDWFLHIAGGQNIRTANTPILLTKLMAHHFLLAPNLSSIEGALRWGQIHGLGGDPALVRAVAASRIGADFSNDEFWTSVFRFFIANPMLDRVHVGPIIDYLHAQRFAERDVINEHGYLVRSAPPQPNLTMRGRTPASLLAQVERWHQDLGRARGLDDVRFKPSGIRALDIKAGSDENPSVWRFRELLSTADLVEDGNKMRHCVASYSHSCASGRCSIWSMEHHNKMGREKRQTIEVSKGGVIVQCRGKLNRFPTPGELDMVQRWARHAGLSVSPYVRAAA